MCALARVTRVLPPPLASYITQADKQTPPCWGKACFATRLRTHNRSPHHTHRGAVASTTTRQIYRSNFSPSRVFFSHNTPSLFYPPGKAVWPSLGDAYLSFELSVFHQAHTSGLFSSDRIAQNRVLFTPPSFFLFGQPYCDFHTSLSLSLSLAIVIIWLSRELGTIPPGDARHPKTHLWWGTRPSS